MELTVTPQKSTNHPSSKNLLEAGIFPLFDPSKFKAKSEDNRNKAVFVKGKLCLKPGQNMKEQNFFQLDRFLNTFLQLAGSKIILILSNKQCNCIAYRKLNNSCQIKL